jgi:Ca2+/Na+ antiporter
MSKYEELNSENSHDEIKKKNKDSKTILFWSEDPNILFKSEYLFEFFPIESMTYEQKMNSISRLIIFLTIIAFIFTRNIRLLLIATIILASIFLLYTYQKKEEIKKENLSNSEEDEIEPFGNRALEILGQKNIKIPENVFDEPTSANPFSNVLMSDYDYNPNKKPAAPCYNEKVNNDILGQAKQLVIDANPDQPNIADKLFKSLGDQLEFEQSLRPFHSTPSTTIPNDQSAFADFCFGSMISNKEGNLFSAARNLPRYTGN